MPRVHFVKKARKDNPAVKKGESYYYWTFRYGGKRYSATPPRQSQLTQSEFLSTIYGIVEEIEDYAHSADDFETMMSDMESFAEEKADEIESLGEEQESKKYDLPDNFQEGPTGQLFEDRAQYCTDMADELRGIDFSFDDDEADDDEKQDAIDDKLSEMQNVSYDGE